MFTSKSPTWIVLLHSIAIRLVSKSPSVSATVRSFSVPAGIITTLAWNTWESAAGSPPPPGTTGLYHLAIRYPDRASLADAYQRLRRAEIPLDGTADHGVSEALYLRDPDSNGVELYCDRPRESWPRNSEGELTMYTRPLDLDSLLAELDDHG